jgi:hypothetical protein
MSTSLFIVDDFLPKPDMVREQVVNFEFNTTGEFPGVRSFAADDDYQMYCKTRFEDIMGVKITEFLMDSFCWQLCYEGAETWIHKDPSMWAGVLYLNPDAPIEAGTGLYKEVKEQEFELVDAIGNIYNRLILYRGDILHRSLLSGFGNCKRTGRLTQVFFFNVKDQPAGGWEG